MQINTGDD